MLDKKYIEVGNKVKILDVENIIGGSEHWENGDVVKINKIVNVNTCSGKEMNIYLKRTSKDYSEYENFLSIKELEFVELAKESKKNKEIRQLKEEIQQLKNESALAASKDYEETKFIPVKPYPYTCPQELDLDSIFGTDEQQEGSAEDISNNTKRKNIIQEADKFIKLDQYRSRGFLKLKDSRGDHLDNWLVEKVDFTHSYKNRTVTLRIYGQGGKTIDRHTVKCHPKDVFNVSIGKAIVLGRALGLDVSKFENAAQPDEFVIGQFVKDLVEKDSTSFFVKTTTKDFVSNLDTVEDQYGIEHFTIYLKITGDTSAKY